MFPWPFPLAVSGPAPPRAASPGIDGGPCVFHHVPSSGVWCVAHEATGLSCGWGRGGLRVTRGARTASPQATRGHVAGCHSPTLHPAGFLLHTQTAAPPVTMPSAQPPRTPQVTGNLVSAPVFQKQAVCSPSPGVRTIRTWRALAETKNPPSSFRPAPPSPDSLLPTPSLRHLPSPSLSPQGAAAILRAAQAGFSLKCSPLLKRI